MSAGFLSVLSQAQRLVTERARAGDAVVDATAGGGVDTLFLARLVGPDGRVFAFDVQAEALDRTRQRLEDAYAAGERLAGVAEHADLHADPALGVDVVRAGPDPAR